MEVTIQCDDAVILSDAFIDDELTDEARQEVWRHIRGCGDCTALIEEKAALKRMVHDGARRLMAPAVLRQNLRALVRI